MSSSRPFRSFLFLLIAGLLLASSVNAQNLVTGPGTLNSTGLWHVTQNIQAPCNGVPLLDIRAHGVTLDLQGYTLECTDGSDPVIRAAGYGNLVVRDGNLRGPATVIQIEPVYGLTNQWTYRFEKLRLLDFTIGISASGTGGAGFEIRDCDLLSLHGERGLDLDRFRGVSIVETTVRFNRPKEPGIMTYGIDIQGVEAVEIRDSIVNSAFWGISLSEVEGGRVVGNSVIRNGMGILLTEGTRWVTVRDNTITGYSTSFDGIRVMSGAHENAIESNLLLGNRAIGLLIVGNDNVYSDNRIVGPSTIGAISVGGSGNLDGGGNVF